MGSLNIASLVKHFDELQVFMEEEPFDVLAINETGLDSSILDCSVSLPGYNLLRRDRNRNGGGFCVYIRKTIEFKHLPNLEMKALEMIVFSVKKPNSKDFLIFAWYRLPNCSLEHFNDFQDFLNKAEQEFDDLYVMGDVNANMLNILDAPRGHFAIFFNHINCRS